MVNKNSQMEERAWAGGWVVEGFHNASVSMSVSSYILRRSCNLLGYDSGPKPRTGQERYSPASMRDGMLGRAFCLWSG